MAVNWKPTILVTTCCFMALFWTVHTATVVVRHHKRSRSPFESEFYTGTDGDIRFSALLPVHTTTVNGSACSEVYVNGLVLTEAISFAVREVRWQKLLPEGITLGYEIYDTCNSVLVSQRKTLDLVLQTLTDQQQLSSSRRAGKLIAVIGAGNSKISLSVNRILNALSIPQIGFASTSRYLSNKLLYSSFLRTVPTDIFQVKALIALFQKFAWNYVALLFSDGDYGRPLAEAFKDSAKEGGICIGFEHVIPQNNRTKIDIIIQQLKTMSELQMVIIFVPETTMKDILNAMVKFDLVNKTLIASDSWSLSAKSYGKQYREILRGTLGLTHRYVLIEQFDKYFLSLTPSVNTWNQWFNETWEHLFKCKLQLDKVNDNVENISKTCDITQQRLHKDQFSKYPYALHVINAVFALAHGIRQFCQDFSTNKGSPPDGSSRGDLCLSSITPKNLAKRLFGMKFRGYDGSDIRFDKSGDVAGSYDLINILPDLSHQTVGIWKNTGTLHVNTSKIVWKIGEKNIAPQDTCTQACAPGSYKVRSSTSPHCCWKCQQCPERTVSNHSDAMACKICGERFHVNHDRTECIRIPVEYFDWNNSFAVALIIADLMAISFLLFVVILFSRFSNTPVVKSSNRELSFLLCIGLFATFLKPFAYTGMPTPTKCIASQLLFCVGAALALSAMLFKTFRIVLVFESQRRRWFLENKYEVALTIALASIELVFCLLWLAINPSRVDIITTTNHRRFMVCHFDKYWYVGSYLLLIVLSLVCTAMAYRGRKLPKNFNEAKYITFSMFTFIIIWAVFMGAQYGASQEYYSQINCFAVIMSSFMILALLFGPKAFLLLFRPELNRPAEFQHEVSRYSFQASNMNIVETGSNKSSGTISMASQRATILPESSKNHLLTIPNNINQFKRARSHTFDVAMSGEHASLPHATIQSLNGISSAADQRQRWPRRPSDIGTYPVSVSVRKSRDLHEPNRSSEAFSPAVRSLQARQRLYDNMIQRKKSSKPQAGYQRKHCEYCHQSIMKCLSLSLPNLPSHFADISPVDRQAIMTPQKSVKDTCSLKSNDGSKRSTNENGEVSDCELSPLLLSDSFPDATLFVQNEDADENQAFNKYKSKDIKETVL